MNVFVGHRETIIGNVLRWLTHLPIFLFSIYPILAAFICNLYTILNVIRKNILYIYDT